MQTKILPLYIDIVCSSECWNRQIIAMALTNRNNFGWYVNRFNDYCFCENFTHQFYYRRTHENYFFVDFSDVLSVKRYLWLDNPISFIRKKILNNEYISMLCSSIGLTKIDKVHEILIVGFDDKNIYFYNYFNNNNVIDKMENEELIKRYECAKEQVATRNIVYLQQALLPISTFEVRNANKVDYTPNLIYTIEDILFEKKETHIGKFGKAVFYHSLSTCTYVSKFLRGDWSNSRPFLAIEIMQKYLETREQLKYKLNYLKIHDFDYLYDSLIKNITIAKGMLCKYFITKAEDLGKRICKILKEIKKADSICLLSAKEKLEQIYLKSVEKQWEKSRGNLTIS